MVPKLERPSYSKSVHKEGLSSVTPHVLYTRPECHTLGKRQRRPQSSGELLSFLLEDAVHCIGLIIATGNSMLEDAQRIPGDQFKSLYDIFYWKIRLG